MKTKQYIGTFYSEEELISKMDELHIQGHREEDFYVIVKEKSNIALVRSQMDAEIATTKPSWIDRIRGNKGRDQEVDDLFGSLDLSDNEIEQRKTEVEGGGFVLLLEVQDIQFDPHLNTDNTHPDVKVRYGSGEETHTSSDANSNAQLGSGNPLDVDKDSKEEHAEIDLHRAGTDKMAQDEQAIDHSKNSTGTGNRTSRCVGMTISAGRKQNARKKNMMQRKTAKNVVNRNINRMTSPSKIMEII